MHQDRSARDALRDHENRTATGVAACSGMAFVIVIAASMCLAAVGAYGMLARDGKLPVSLDAAFQQHFSAHR